MTAYQWFRRSLQHTFHKIMANLTIHMYFDLWLHIVAKYSCKTCLMISFCPLWALLPFLDILKGKQWQNYPQFSAILNYDQGCSYGGRRWVATPSTRYSRPALQAKTSLPAHHKCAYRELKLAPNLLLKVKGGKNRKLMAEKRGKCHVVGWDAFLRSENYPALKFG